MTTSLEDLKRIGATETELPPFSDGTPFIAKLKTVSIIDMARNGRIPNPLMKTILKVLGADDENTDVEKFEENTNNEIIANEEDTKQTFDFILTVVKSSLVSPTYKEIEECGVTLSDEQIFSIFSHALGGIELLSKFC